MNFLDNVWNLSSLHSSLTNETINGGGKVSQLGSDYYYYFMKSPFQYSLPLSIYLYITFSYSYNAVYVNFGYSLGSSTPITWYDTVTIHESGVNNASLVISGYSLNPGGGFYDSELVFGRERNSEVTDFTSMNATLSMKYKLPNGSLSLPPALYGFGSDTAKAADDLSTVLINGTPTVEIGNGNFSPIYYSVEILTFSAQLTLNTSTVDANMKVPVKLSSSLSNGVLPYTYYFYLDGRPIYNFTTYSSQLSETLYLPQLNQGTYKLEVSVCDSAGHKAYSSNNLKVNPDLIGSITSNVSVTDANLPFNFSYFAYNGTPPYNYSLYVNGELVGKNNSYIITWVAN